MRKRLIHSKRILAVALIAVLVSFTGRGKAEAPVPSVHVKKLADSKVEKQKEKPPAKILQGDQGGDSRKVGEVATRDGAEASAPVPNEQVAPEKKKSGLKSLFSRSEKKKKLGPAREVAASAIAPPVKEGSGTTKTTP